MIRIILGNGDSYEGVNETEVIQELKMEDWTEYNNMGEYKNNIGRRVRIFNGEIIKYKTDREFLEELKRIGYIIEIEEVI